MTPDGRLRVVQIGGGPDSDYYLRAFVEIPSVADVVLVEPDAARREALAARWGIVKRAVGNWREALADPAADLAHVALPPAQAPAAARAALAAGKHVILSGPGASSLADLDALVQAAHQARRQLFVSLPQLLHPAVERAAALVEAGEIGEVHLAEVALLTATPEAPPPGSGSARRAAEDTPPALGAAFDALYVLQRLLGPARAVVAARRGDCLGATLLLGKSALATLTVGPAEQGGRRREERRLTGAQGTLLLRDDPEDELPLVLLRGEEVLPLRVRCPLEVRPLYLARMLAHFVDCLRQGRAPGVTLDQARAALATALAVEEAATGGLRVTVSR